MAQRKAQEQTKDDRWGPLGGEGAVGVRKGEMNGVERRGGEKGGKRRGGSCQDDLSLPSTDPDAALFPKQLCVCVCVFFPNTPNRDLAFRDSAVQ